MQDILTRFKNAGDLASFHFTDTSGEQQSLARTYREEALGIYRDYPEYHDEMRKIAEDFIWELRG